MIWKDRWDFGFRGEKDCGSYGGGMGFIAILVFTICYLFGRMLFYLCNK